MEIWLKINATVIQDSLFYKQNSPEGAEFPFPKRQHRNHARGIEHWADH